MKIRVEMDVQRDESGGRGVRLVVDLEANAGGYGKEPLMGAIDHTFDGARKAILQALDAKSARA